MITICVERTVERQDLWRRSYLRPYSMFVMPV